MKMPRLARTDWGVLLITLGLVLVGLVMIYSASFAFPMMGWLDVTGPAHFFVRQLVFGGIGLVGLFIAWRVDYHAYRRIAVPVLVATVIILLIMALLRGRWLLRARSVQPFEIARVGAMIYIAAWLESLGKELRRITFGLVPFALLMGTMTALVVAQKDYSSAVLLVATATAMFFVAGADMRQLTIAVLVGGGALVGVAFLVPYMRERLFGWQLPLVDPRDSGFQTVQSLVALIRGGFTGVGFTQSLQKLNLQRVAHTDYIFAIIGEEWGFVGAILVMGLFALWVWRALKVARGADDAFGRLLAVGIVAWTAFSVALNVAVVTNSTPVTGSVLPFVSYGGSSLITSLGTVGILLNISRSDHRRRRERSP